MASTVSHFNIKVAVDSKTGQVNIENFGKAAEKSADRASKSFSGMKVAVTGAIIAVGAALVKFTRAAERQIQAEQKLSAAFAANGEDAARLTEEYKAFASEIQRTTVIGDEQVLELAQMGKSLGVTTDRLQETTKGAIGLSKALGIDTTAAMRAAALANQGEYTMLQRYIPALRTANTEAEKAAIVQEAMAKGFKIAEAEAQTAAGRFQQLKNRFGDFQETVGALVFDLLDGLNPVIESLMGLLEQIVPAVKPILEALGNALAPIIQDLADAIVMLLDPFRDLIKNVLAAAQPIIQVVLLALSKIAPLFGKVATAVGHLVDAMAPMIDMWATMAEEQLDDLVELLDAVLSLFIALAPAITLASKATAAIMSIQMRFVNMVVTPIIKAIRFILEKGAEAARWVRSIFGGGGDAATKAKTAPGGGGGGGGGPQEGDISPDGTMIYQNGKWVKIEQGTGGGGGGTGKASPVAGSIPALEAQLKLLEGLRDNTVAGSAAWADYTLKIAAAQAELDMFKRIANDLVGEGPEGRGVSPFKQLADEIALVPVAAAPAIDATVSLVDKLAASYEQLGIVAGNVTGALGNIFAENFEVMKAISVAETVINTSTAIMKTLAQGGAWALPIALSVGALGATQIAKILATKPGSGGGGGGSTPAPVQSGSAPSRGGPPVRRLSLSGGDSSPMSFPQEIKLRAEGGDLVGVMQVNTRASERSGV